MANGTFCYTAEVGIIRNPPLNSEFHVEKELRQQRFQILDDFPLYQWKLVWCTCHLKDAATVMCTNNNNSRAHLAFPTYKWNVVNSNVESFPAPNSNYQGQWNTPWESVSQGTEDRFFCLQTQGLSLTPHPPLSLPMSPPSLSYSWYVDTALPRLYWSRGRPSHAVLNMRSLWIQRSTFLIRVQPRPPAAKDDTPRCLWRNVCPGVCSGARVWARRRQTFLIEL